MARISDLSPDREITVPVGDLTVVMTYAESVTTSEWTGRLSRCKGNEEASVMLAEAIVEWDITDDNDEPWPTDADGIARLGLRLVSALSAALMEDVVGGKGSGPASSRKGSTGRSRPGTPVFEPPAT